jgi:AcrR family transcriptional regulator
MSKAEKTRQLIVEKTAPIFNTKGYAGTSLTDMTAATGLTKGSIYGNFENKDEVAIACFDYNHQIMISLLHNAMEKETTYRGKLLVYSGLFDHLLQATTLHGGCPILNTATEADDTHPALRSKAASALEAWKGKVISLLTKGIENGEFKKDIDIEQVALTIIATVEGAIMITKVTGKLNYRNAIMTSVKNMINAL